MCVKCASDEELLEELTTRVKIEKIRVRSNYYYETDEIETRFESPDSVMNFSNRLNIEKQLRYRQSYETYCLPLVNQQQEKKLNKNFELLKKTLEK